MSLVWESAILYRSKGDGLPRQSADWLAMTEQEHRVFTVRTDTPRALVLLRFTALIIRPYNPVNGTPPAYIIKYLPPATVSPPVTKMMQKVTLWKQSTQTP